MNLAARIFLCGMFYTLVIRNTALNIATEATFIREYSGFGMDIRGDDRMTVTLRSMTVFIVTLNSFRHSASAQR